METRTNNVPYPIAGILLIISGALLILASLLAGGKVDIYTAALVSSSMAFAVAMLRRKPLVSLCIATGLVTFVHILPILQLFELGEALMPNLIFRLLRLAGMAVLLAITIGLAQKKPMPKSPIIWMLPLLLFGAAWLASTVVTLVQSYQLALATDAAWDIFLSAIAVFGHGFYVFAIGRHSLWLQSFDGAEE